VTPAFVRPPRFAGCRALVTGAGSGIGRAITLAMIEEGASVIVVGRRDALLDETVALAEPFPGTAIPYSCDVSDAAAIGALESKTVETFGGLDVLVCNAAVGGTNGRFHEIPLQALDAVIASNVRGTYLTLQAGLRMMLAAGGNIVVVGSLGALRPAPRASAYGMSKAATHAMARHAAIEYARLGIRVNVVAPGATDTDLLASADDDVRAAVADVIPDGRIGSTAEVARIALFLASDESSHITGQVLAVDGGSSAAGAG
jgi:NAD(P)-dependent dehydrogenase (short-subunit alcohol dehydrogenase family)